MKMFIGGCCCGTPEGWCNLRGYNFTTGAILWEHKLFSPTMATDNTVVGIAAVESAENYSHVYHRRASSAPPARGADTHSTAGKKTWELRATRINVSTGAITEQVAVMAYVVTADDFDIGVNNQLMATDSTTGTVWQPIVLMATQRYGASDVSFIGGTPSVPTIAYFDPHSSSATLKYRIMGHGAKPVSAGAAMWSWGIPAFGGDPSTTAEWSHDATAATIKTALEVAPQIVSATVTGGPLPHNAVDISVEWASNTLQFSNTNRTNYAMATGRTVISTSTGNVVGWGHLPLVSALMYASDGNIVELNSDWELKSKQPDTLGTITTHWTSALSNSFAGVLTAKTKILWAAQLSPESENPQETAGMIGKLHTLSIADGSTLATTSMVYRYPEFIAMADGSETSAILRGRSWAPSTTNIKTPDENEKGVSDFRHDDFINDLSDGLNPQYYYPSGVKSIGGNSTRLAFFHGSPRSVFETAAVRMPSAGGGLRSIVNTPGGDGLYPYTYDKHFYYPAHTNVRSTTSAEWRIGIGTLLAGFTYTDWMAYATDEDAVNAELRDTYGEHTAVTFEEYNNNVRVMGDSAVSDIAGIPNMLWQSAQFMIISDVGGSYDTLQGKYIDTSFTLMDFQVRNQVFPRSKSFGAMNWADGTVAWEKNNGTKVIGGDALYGEEGAFENNVLVVRDFPSYRLTVE